MLLDPLSVDGHTRLHDVKDVLRYSAQPAFPVTDRGYYVGILDATTVRRSPPDLLAGDIADHDAPALDTTDAIDPTALEALEDSGRNVLAVLHSGQVVGLLRDEDIVDRLQGPSPPKGTPRRAF
jgi:CBS domain-containing protein